MLAFANDICLNASNPEEMQAMLNIAGRYATDWAYDYNAGKSVHMCFNRQRDSGTMPILSLNGNPIIHKEEHTYLGIQFRCKNIVIKDDTTQKAMLTRRTLYSLTGAGTHSQGIPCTRHIYIYIYCLSRLMYGMEVINISKSNREELDKHQLLIMKQVIGLPNQTANAAATALTGAIPISTRIQEQKILALLVHKNPTPLTLLYCMLGTTNCKKWCLS